MIERYVFVKLTDEHATDEGRQAVVAETKRVLPELPGVVGLRVGRPADAGARDAWDLSIAVQFQRIEDVEPYRVHPDHRAYVDQFLRPRMVIIKAWNFSLA